MWEEDSDNNTSDNALTLNLQAYGADASAGSSSEELCIDSGTEDDSGSPVQRGRKRKRSEEEVEDGDDEDDSDGAKDGDMPDVVLQMEAEIERQLDSKAKRSNLTVANVKKILKDVITNEQVLDLVRHTMKQPESNFCINTVFSYAPKLTRAKTKELLNTFPSMTWPITPSKNLSNSKCKVLIEQELPEDSSDEEYQPDEDDDDHEDNKHQNNKSNDDKDGEEGEEQADSDEVDAQGDEEEEEDDDEEDDDDDDDDEDDDDDGHESDQNITLSKDTKLVVKKSTRGEEEEEEDDDDDDDCKLVICDNDNETKEIASKDIADKVKCINAVNNIKRSVINDTGTQTSWPEGTENKDQNKPEIADSSNHNNFDIPEENICQRTRSKLSLSDTPLETIESAFIPPDITTDMYDSECDDEDWKNFLKGFTQPLKLATQEAADDDDEEIDPEYNILADEEEADDKEELREDPGVKVSRKEVNALMAELFEYIGMLSDENDGSEKIHKSCENELCSSFEPKNNVDEMKDIAEHIAGAWEQHIEENVQENTTSQTNESVSVSSTSFSSSPEAALPETETTLHNDPLSPAPDDVSEPSEVTLCEMSREQKLLLNQHMRQYVQFLTQHFLLSHLHPLYHVYSMDCKQNLLVLKNLANNNKESTYNADNLDEAIALIEKWEQLYSSESSKKKFIDFMDKEIELQNVMKKRKQFYRGKFPPGFSEIVINSNVFIYPLLLPTNPFRCDGHSTTRFFASEDQLIALGLEHFLNYAQKNPKIWGKVTVAKIVPMIVEHFLPARRTNSVYTRILESNNVENSPIKHFFKQNSAPKKVHYVLPCQGAWIPPCQQPLALLPQVWKDYILSKKKGKL